MKLIIEYLENYDKNWGPMAYKHADDSGFDLRAAIKESMTLAPGQHAVIPNGFKMKIESADNAFELQMYGFFFTKSNFFQIIFPHPTLPAVGKLDVHPA